jgi:hypothetical protein
MNETNRLYFAFAIVSAVISLTSHKKIGCPIHRGLIAMSGNVEPFPSLAFFFAFGFAIGSSCLSSHRDLLLSSQWFVLASSF